MAWTAETKAKFSESRKGSGNPMFGKKQTDEVKALLSEKRLGKNNPFYGKNHTDETKVLQAEASHKRTGWNHTEETKKKIGETRKQRKIPSPHPFKKGHVPWNKGEKLSPLSKEQRLLISASSKGHKKPEGFGAKIAEANKNRIISNETRKRMGIARKGLLVGENNPAWAGGISFKKYGKGWTKALKESIRERDGYTCQVCDIPQNGQKHDVHHVDYEKKNLEFDNLITLCRTCHLRTNWNRESWIAFFEDGR